MGIIRDLYNGETYSFENIVPKDKEYRKTNQKIGEMEKCFSQKLSLEDQKKMEEWKRLLQESKHMETYANFSYGFRLGVMLMMDVLAG